MQDEKRHTPSGRKAASKLTIGGSVALAGKPGSTTTLQANHPDNADENGSALSRHAAAQFTIKSTDRRKR